jgi:hypothetical protein
MFSILTEQKMALTIAHLRTILKIQKTSTEVPI